MSSNLSNAEILNNLLEGRDLDELTSRSLMQRWLNDEIADVETGAFLSALRAKSATGVELSSMAEELLNVCKLPVARPNLYLVDTCGQEVMELILLIFQLQLHLLLHLVV